MGNVFTSSRFFIQGGAMSHPVNDEILENLYEQVCEEYPDLPAIEQVRLAEELFEDLCQ